MGQLRNVRAKKGIGTDCASLAKIQLAIGSMRGVNTYQIDGCGETKIVDSSPPDIRLT